jgi:hypothetical protein
MTPEAKVKARVKKILTDMGAYYAMPQSGGYGNSGTPDFLVCYQGAFVGIECKANGNKPTALQSHHMMQIRKAGGRSFVVDETNIDKLREEMEKW